MNRKMVDRLVVALLAAAAVTVGIATSRAQGETTLKSLSVAQLLAKVALASKTTTAVSGDISWSNGLVPGSDLSGLLSGQAAAPTSLSGLALGGSGRIWLKQGDGLRFDVQGSGSDFVMVAGRDGVWSYSSATDTATHYAVPAGASASAPASASPSPQVTTSTDPLAAIGSALRRFASIGTLSLGDQTTVAGQPSYLLVMSLPRRPRRSARCRWQSTPQTFVSLRVQVFAKGARDRAVGRIHECLLRAPWRRPVCLLARPPVRRANSGAAFSTGSVERNDQHLSRPAQAADTG